MSSGYLDGPGLRPRYSEVRSPGASEWRPGPPHTHNVRNALSGEPESSQKMPAAASRIDKPLILLYNLSELEEVEVRRHQQTIVRCPDRPGVKVMTAKLSVAIALHGDGWWTATATTDGYEPVKCRTDASDDIDKNMIVWMDELAAGRIPPALFFDEETGEVLWTVAATDDPEVVRLVITRDPVDGQPVTVLLDILIDKWELAKAYDHALGMVGRVLQGEQSTRDWIDQ